MSARIASFRPLTAGLAILCLVLTAVSTEGCRSTPVRDLGPTTIHVRASRNQVKHAILAAGASQGWSMKELYPGAILATLTVRSHLAVVQIDYSSSSFRIRYKDSSNLDYNSMDRTIHSNYNDWVERLNNAIVARVSTI
jgi:hypothetical protein